MVLSFLYCFPGCGDKMPDKGGGLFCHLVWGCRLSWWGRFGSRVGNSCWSCVRVRSEEMSVVPPLALSLWLALGLQPRGWCCPHQGGSSHFSRTSLETLSQHAQECVSQVTPNLLKLAETIKHDSPANSGLPSCYPWNSFSPIFLKTGSLATVCHLYAPLRSHLS